MTVRVVQWATGAMGRTILRRLVEHPDVDVVGVLVYHPDKVGRDVGAIAGLPDVGLTATGRPEEIDDLDADVVVHAPRIQPPYTHHDADITRLLRSGKNVLSINGHSMPGWRGTEHAAAFDRAGRDGGATLMAAGLNPGYAFEKLAVGATGLCTSVSNVSVSEVVDTTVMRSPDYVFGVLGFGSRPDAIDPNQPGWPPAELLGGMFGEVLAAAAARLGVELTGVETDHRMHPATRDLAVAAGTIAAGTIARTAWRWHGIVAEQRLLTLSIEWTMEPEASGAAAAPMWRIEVTGDPCVTVDVDLRRRRDDPRRTTPEQYGVAGAVVNAIPHVLAASPGVALPPMAAPWQPSLGR
jgi:hypothetical protein